jgi:sulfur-oxidizing protein SoxZ
MTTNVRVDVPKSARRGEIVEIKTLVAHPMENGFRRTHLGKTIARNIITSLTCTYNGVEVFRAVLHPSIAANPYVQFTTIATESGVLEFKWSGDNGFSATASAHISVS